MSPESRVDYANDPKPNCGECGHPREQHGCRSDCVCNGYVRPALDPMSRDPLELAEVRAQRIAGLLEAETPRGWGFGLVMFSYGEAGLITWISSARRDDMAKALRELLTRWEADQPSL